MPTLLKPIPAIDHAVDALLAPRPATPIPRGADQFYTNDALADDLVRLVLKRKLPDNALFVEPAAGTGAFVRPLREMGRTVLAVDIDPQSNGIRRGDFLASDFIPIAPLVVVIGNPPFGFASSLAIRFFNKAAEKAKIIAFIVPRTFRKQSVRDKLNLSFHLRHDQDIPKNAFIKDGQPHDVPCAFQIWVRQPTKRKRTEMPDISHLIHFTTPDKAHFALRRVGGRAGQILPGTHHTPSTTYFIRGVRPGIRKVLERIDWSDIREQTAGVRSISKLEIAEKLLAAVK